MRKTLDRRVTPDFVLDFVRACQERVPCHLGGGAALAGAYLGHRTTGDIDLFCHDAGDMRSLVSLLPSAAAGAGIGVTVVGDVGHLVRAQLEAPDGSSIEVDVVHDPVADIATPPPQIEGIVVESLIDLRAKLCAKTRVLIRACWLGSWLSFRYVLYRRCWSLSLRRSWKISGILLRRDSGAALWSDVGIPLE